MNSRPVSPRLAEIFTTIKDKSRDSKEINSKIIDLIKEVDVGELSSAFDEKGNTLLAYTAELKDPAILKLLIHAKVDVNQKCANGDLPLFWAIDHDRREHIELLIEAKVDINSTNREGTTALHCAAEAKRVELTQRLVTAKATIDMIQVNKEGVKSTPLLSAISRKDHEIVKQLLAAKANPNFADNFNSALSMAVCFNDEHIVTQLLEAKADPNKKIKGESVLSMAVKRGHEKIVAQLLLIPILDQYGMEDRNEKNRLLISAVKFGHEKIAEKLLDAKANPNSEDKEFSAISYAATYGDVNVLEKLLHCGANPIKKKKQRNKFITSVIDDVLNAAPTTYLRCLQLLIPAVLAVINDPKKFDSNDLNLRKTNFDRVDEKSYDSDDDDGKHNSAIFEKYNASLKELNEFVNLRIQALTRLDTSAALEKKHIDNLTCSYVGKIPESKQILYVASELHMAARVGDEKRLDLISKSTKQNFDLLDANTFTPLQALLEYTEIPEKLEPSERLEDTIVYICGKTSLHYKRNLLHFAAFTNRKELLEFIIEHFYSDKARLRQDALAKDDFGCIPLDYTARDTHSYLLEKYEMKEFKEPEFTYKNGIVVLKDGRYYEETSFCGEEKCEDPSCVCRGGFGQVFKLKPLDSKDQPLIMKKIFDRSPRERTVRPVSTYQETAMFKDANGYAVTNGSMMIMEELPGVSYTQSDCSRLSLAELTSIAKSITNAVAELHEKNIIHLDLALRNILINKCIEPGDAKELKLKYEVKIIDFGLSVRRGEFTKQLLLHNGLSDLPPEYNPPKPAEPSMDIYRLGFVFAEMFRNKFGNKCDLSIPDQRRNQLNYAFRDHPETVREILIDTLCRMTDPDPSKRPSIKDIGVVFEKLATLIPPEKPPVFIARETTAGVQYFQVAAEPTRRYVQAAKRKVGCP